jgi:O-antigen ligase
VLAAHADATAGARRLMALPFLVFMASSGLPIAYSLAPTRPMLVADVAEATAAAASSANMLSSLANLLLLATLYGMAGTLLLRYPRSAALLLRRHWQQPAMLLLLLAGVLWSAYPAKVAMNFVHGTGVTLIALAAALHYRDRPWTLPPQLAMVLGLNMALQLAAVAAAPSYAIDWQQRWQGLTPHPNTLGALAFTTFWANACVLVCLPRARRRRWHWLFCVLAAAAALGADSVTSKLCSAVALLLLLLLRSWQRRAAGPRLYLGAVLLAVLGSGLFQLLKSAVPLDWLYDMLGRDSQLTGRAQVWQDAYRAIGAKPWLGWSFDDHAELISTAGMPYSSYHNGALDLAVSGGIAALALFALLLAGWARSYLHPDRQARALAPCSAAFTLAYLMHNQSEASFFAPRGQMWVIFLTLLLLGACPRNAPERP